MIVVKPPIVIPSASLAANLLLSAVFFLVKLGFEVILTVTVTAKFGEKTVFLVEVGQAGIFRIMNVPEDQIEPLIAVACPNILFPYARETVSDAVTRAGFSPIVLQPVNFEAMYMQRIQEQTAASAEPTIQ